MPDTDYYSIMGVSRTASADEIKKAYRKLARKLHPDVSKEANAESEFKALTEAYEVLRDPEKRAQYDRLGANWRNAQDFGGQPDWGAGGAGATGGFSDFFDNLFSKQQAGRRPPRGPGRQMPPRPAQPARADAQIEISIEDAFHGASRKISISSPSLSGGAPRTRTLDVRVPKGVKAGQKIRLAGQAETGGDLFLEIKFKSHPYYRADGKDLYVMLPVSPWEAMLGATVKTPTPSGAVDLTIPAGSQNGRKLRMRGRGIPAAEPGDLYVELKVILPEADTAASKAAYQSMKDAADFDPRQGMKL
ncbi:MAG: DnaJ C-terminal domain-containing protein [Burkholderiaceae bacterium]